MTAALALLRGVNVGGKAKLPMRELAEIFSAAGAQDVQTYIQSGNVTFRAQDSPSVTKLVTDAIKLRYGYPGRIVLLTREELEKIVDQNPFVRAGVPVQMLNVYLLADQPTSAAVKLLDPERSSPDTFVVRGRAIYLHVPNGMARTKLTNTYFDAKLQTTSTARNWRTTTELLERMRGV